MASEIRKFYEFGKFRFDAQTHCLKFENELVTLPPKSLEALGVLLENRGDVVTREALLDAVWEESYVDDANLTVAVSGLRKTFAGYNGNQDYIQTVSRKGYRFTADVEEKIEIRDQPIIVSRQLTETYAVDARPRFRGIVYVATALFALALLGGGLVAWRSTPQRQIPAPAPPSLAVLPFRDLTGTAGDDFWADGITESLITELSKTQGLKVISRNSIFALKGKEFDYQETARKLGVTHLLEGSVRRDGDVIRLESRLLKAETGEVVWTSSYERKADEVLTVEDGIACAIAGELRSTLCGTKDTEPKKYKDNLKAYQAFLKGRFLFYQRGDEPMKKAVAEFERSLSFDPNYAIAMAALAEDYVVMETNGVIPPGAGLPKATILAERSIQIDPNLPGGYAALGLVRTAELKPVEAEQYFSKAIEVNPNYALAWQWRSTFYLGRSRFADAEAGFKKALDLDPLSLSINYSLAEAYLKVGDYDRALEQANHYLSIYPENFGGYQLRALAYDRLGRYDEALAAAERSHITNVDPFRALIYCHSGQIEKARPIVLKIESSETATNNPYQLALLNAALGETDRSLFWLERAVEKHQTALTEIPQERDFDSIRSDPRFIELVQRASATS